MWNKIQYGLIFAWAKLHAFLPMSVLYTVRYPVCTNLLGDSLQDKSSAPQPGSLFPREIGNRITPVGKGLLPSFCRLHCRDNQTGAYLSRRSIAPCPYQESRSGNPFAAEGQKTVMMLMGHYGNGNGSAPQPGIYRFVPVANLPTVKNKGLSTACSFICAPLRFLVE